MAGAYCYNCGRFDIGAYCSACGSEMKRPTGLLSTLKPFAQPLLEYFQHSARLATPTALVGEIKTGRFHGAKLVAFSLSAIALSTVFEAIFPSTSVQIVNIPLISESIIVTILFLAATISYLPLHFILNRGGRGITLGQYALAVTAVTALYYPWATLALGIAQSLTGKDFSSAASYGATYFFLATFSALYGRNFFNVLGWTLVYLIAIVVGIAALFFSGIL